MGRPTAIKLLLYPLSLAYGTAIWVRNKLFDWHILPQRKFEVPVIAVGNIAVGGTGKTPHTEYIVSALTKNRRVGVLSRGYKRHTKGFVLASPHTTPNDIGDEAYQIYHKFGGRVMMAVCENRARGIERMLEIDPKLDVIVLDDALQHRYVKPRITVVLTEFERPFFKDELLPLGRLRESRHALNRADIVVVTKCPAAIKPIDINIFDKDLNLFPSQSRFYSRYRYEHPRALYPEMAVPTPDLPHLGDKDMLLSVTGIGNPRPFVRFLKSFRPKVKVNVFADHHTYSRKDLDMLQQRFDGMHAQHKYIMTTEKDAVRLLNCPYFPHELKPYIFYLPIRVEFIEADARRADLAFADDIVRRLENDNIL